MGSRETAARRSVLTGCGSMGSTEIIIYTQGEVLALVRL